MINSQETAAKNPPSSQVVLPEEEYKSTLSEIEKYKSKAKHLEEENKSLHLIIKKLKDSKFGKKSEKYVDNNQLNIFNEAEDLDESTEDENDTSSSAPELEGKDEIITYTRKKPGKGKKASFPEFLDREVIDYGLEENKTCSLHNQPMEHMGYESQEKLITKPAEHIVREERTHKYKCLCCEAPKRAEKPEALIPKSIATPEMLSFIIFSKYQQALSLYRVEEFYTMFEIQGVSRSNMSRWLIQVAERLKPVYNILADKVFETGYINIDETRVQVLKENGRRAEAQSSMWAFGSCELNITLFDYNISKGSPAVKRILDEIEYKGAVQSDEHSCYNYLNTNKEVIRLGCMMHARRKFMDAHKLLDMKSSKCKHALKIYKKLYQFEKEYKEKNLSFEERFWSRIRDQVPLLNEYKAWLKDLRPKAPPTSPLGKAIRYSLNHWEHLTNYLCGGRYEIDNGFVERSIKHFAVGRKNWLFSDTEKGAEASSLYYSLAVTARQNKINLYEAMCEILNKLPQAKTYEDFEQLAQILYLKKQ